MAEQTSPQPSESAARAPAAAKRPLVHRFLAGPAFVPASIVAICLLIALTGTQLVQLYQTAGAHGWWQYHDPVAFTGPGLDDTATTVEAFVLGAVQWPGAYALAPGARIADLVAAAGGLLPAADAAALDESAVLSQGQRVYVPLRGEPPGAFSSELVDVNTATADQLHTALGVTTAIAARIVAYRDQHGPFTALSQLLQVPITRTTFDRIKYLITL